MARYTPSWIHKRRSDILMQPYMHDPCHDAISLLDALFGPMTNLWPPCISTAFYVEYLQQKFQPVHMTCFEPLWKGVGYEWPPKFTDSLEFVHRIITLLRETTRKDVSIDEILKFILPQYKTSTDQMNQSERNNCRQSIFQVLSCLTMMYDCSNGTPISKFRISVDFPDENTIEERSIDEATRPFIKLLKGFGPLLPSFDQIKGVIEAAPSDLIHASSLNIASLILIDKINIKWTHILSQHMVFDPLSRTLLLYQSPSFCALLCANEHDADVFNNLMGGYYFKNEKATSILRKFKREVILSYRVLFGQSRRSRRIFCDMELQRRDGKDYIYDPLLNVLCGSAIGPEVHALPSDIWPASCRDSKGQLLEQSVYSAALDFPILGRRILDLQAFDTRQQPSKIRDIWRDRRNLTQWYTFWAVLIIGGLSLLISLLQLFASVAQLAVSV